MVNHYLNVHTRLHKNRALVTHFHCVGLVWRGKGESILHTAIIQCMAQEGARKKYRQKGILCRKEAVFHWGLNSYRTFMEPNVLCPYYSVNGCWLNNKQSKGKLLTTGMNEVFGRVKCFKTKTGKVQLYIRTQENHLWRINWHIVN